LRVCREFCGLLVIAALSAWAGLTATTAQAQAPQAAREPSQPNEPSGASGASEPREPRERLAPLWEAGIGGALLTLPHYRGSDQSRTWLLPVPYGVYRGRFLRADREGARAVLFERRAFEIDMSVAGSAPARSDDNRARQGMPDLAPTIEFGPNANFTFGRGPDWKVELRAPLRAAYTLERSARHVGWTATPYLTAEWTQGGWDLGVRGGWLWGDRRFNGYTYDVAPEFATAERPAYRSPSGTAGWQLTVGGSRRFGDLFVAAFARADNLQSAAFAASPLVKRDNTWAAGVLVSWVFAKSSQMVKVPD
jgi:MipA family protein